ncbi:type II toxin-antitoxin system death-on-curing family toxin [Lewinella sp. IMCC34191]|uniref:type II toxin-antitoxin system death-on-curing family toxin n=1 Tax=Lewinella sp. IMCC34191 TaxID=2259172 RepID=UPI000E269CCD|nr:type II toxin-antitoxin system death-on-curing family toxin [Lewinella sp. IMCC34191]
MRYLTKPEIFRLNKLTLARHGGHFVPPDNSLHPEAIDYLVESVQAEMFGEPLYPRVSDKAALYMFNLIGNHAFQDGNKRTGLAAALAFLMINDYRLKEDLQPVTYQDKLWPDARLGHDDHVYRFTLAVAAGQVPLEACRQWFAANIESIA